MTTLSTNIMTATVYPDRALITRRGTLSLEAGNHSIEITPSYPSTFQPDFFHSLLPSGTAHTHL